MFFFPPRFGVNTAAAVAGVAAAPWVVLRAAAHGYTHSLTHGD